MAREPSGGVVAELAPGSAELAPGNGELGSGNADRIERAERDEHACLTPGERTYRVTGLATPDGIEAVHELVERARRDHPEIAALDLMLFETALIELANNVVEHGHPAGQVRWRMLLSVNPKSLEAELIDTSEAVTLTIGKAMPAVEATSGRGLPIIEAALDYLILRRVGAENHWLLLRWLGRA